MKHGIISYAKKYKDWFYTVIGTYMKGKNYCVDNSEVREIKKSFKFH